MRTKTIKMYSFDELSEKAKETARNWWREAAGCDEWWETVFEDARQVGLSITSFDTGRSHEIEGDFVSCPVTCAEEILKIHGDGRTCAEANAFLKLRHEFMQKAQKDEWGEIANYEQEEELEQIEKDFLHAILEEYLITLRNDYEHYFSEDHVDECIRINEYEFTEGGKIA